MISYTCFIACILIWPFKIIQGIITLRVRGATLQCCHWGVVHSTITEYLTRRLCDWVVHCAVYGSMGCILPRELRLCWFETGLSQGSYCKVCWARCVQLVNPKGRGYWTINLYFTEKWNCEANDCSKLKLIVFIVVKKQLYYHSITLSYKIVNNYYLNNSLLLAISQVANG